MYLSYAVRGAVPLLISPYLVRTLHAHNWGIFSLIYAYCALMFQVVEFGFGLSATRDVAMHREDRKKISEILWAVLTCQAVLSALIVATVYPAFLLMDLTFRWNILLPTLIFIVFQGAMPLWFFRGLERLVLVATLTIISRLSVLVFIPIYVKGPGDICDALWIFALSATTSTIIGYSLAALRAEIVRPSFEMIRRIASEAFPLFAVQISAGLLTIGNTVIMGLFVSPVQIGYYAGVERVVTGLRQMMNPAVDTLFPRISRILTGQISGERVVRTAMAGMVGLGAVMTVLLMLLAHPVIRFIFGSEVPPALSVLYVLALGPVMIGVVHALGTLWLLPLGDRKSYSSALLLGAGINISLLLISLQIWPDRAYVAAAASAVIGQAAMAAFLIARARRTKGSPLYSGR